MSNRFVNLVVLSGAVALTPAISAAQTSGGSGSATTHSQTTPHEKARDNSAANPHAERNTPSEGASASPSSSSSGQTPSTSNQSSSSSKQNSPTSTQGPSPSNQIPMMSNPQPSSKQTPSSTQQPNTHSTEKASSSQNAPTSNTSPAFQQESSSPPASSAQSAPPHAVPSARAGATSQPAVDSQEVDGGDERFLGNAAQAGHYETEGSKLALQKSSSESIKTFAQRMIDDHGKVAEELAALARKKGVEVPSEPSLIQKGKLKMLEMRDDGFDEAYAKGIAVEAHEDAVELFEEASKDVEDAEIRAFATKTLATLREHLNMAKKLHSETESRQR